MKKLIVYLHLFLISLTGFAQGTTAGSVEMADKFRADGKIYVVVAVALIILIGIFVYLIMLDRKVNRLEKEINK